MIAFLNIITIIPIQWFSLVIILVGIAAVIYAALQLKVMKQNKQTQELLIKYLEAANKKEEQK